MVEETDFRVLSDLYESCLLPPTYVCHIIVSPLICPHMTIQTQPSPSIPLPIFTMQLGPPVIHTDKDSTPNRIVQGNRQHALPQESSNS